MFSKLGALSKIKPKQQQPAPISSTASLPARRNREEEQQEQEDEKKKKKEEEQQKQEQSNKSDTGSSSDDENNETSSPFRKSYADFTSEEEKALIQEIRSKLSENEKALSEGESKLKELLALSSSSSSATSTTNQDQGKNNSSKRELKDDILLAWVSNQLNQWQFDLLSKKRGTDPADFNAMDACLEKLKSFDTSKEEIQPMIIGLTSHQLPEELTDALFNVYTLVAKDRRFLEAENIYFDYLLGSSNWHIGVYTMLHQRASHESFKVGNVKSKLHNHELRRMMLVFKELMNLEQKKFTVISK